MLSTTGIPWSTATGGFFLPLAQEDPETGEIMSMGFNAQTFGRWYDLQHNEHTIGPPGDPYDISLSVVLSGLLVPQRRYGVGLVEDVHSLSAVLTISGAQDWQYRADAEHGGGSVYIQHIQRNPADGETRIEGSFDLTLQAADGSTLWAVCDGGSFWMTLN